MEEAHSYMAANYSPAECDAILRRLHSPERKRAVVMCADCYTHVGDDHIIPAPVGEMRMRDFVVDTFVVLRKAEWPCHRA